MADATVAIVGAGLGGFQVAASLRELKFAGRVVLIGDEPHPPYQRPPLSKAAFMAGSSDEAHLALRPASFYPGKFVDLLTGRRAVAIDRRHRKVALDDESVINYDHLVLATGARNRPLPVPGTDLEGVHFLRTLDEARAVRARLASAKRIVVVGAGFIGLEFAASALKFGAEITVVEVAERPMARAISVSMASIFSREFTKMGVRLRFGEQVMRLVGTNGRVEAVETVQGELLPCDLVLIGIGVMPNVDLAAACDLEVRDGIVVDQQLITSDPRISAIGDCAAHPNTYAEKVARIESVQNATDQGRCVAARLLGRPSCFSAVPWFWSDQGPLKLQIAGLTYGYDRTSIRGDSNGTSCAVFCFRGERLLGVETVNRAADHMAARRLIANRVAITPEQAADESFDLRSLTSTNVAEMKP